MKKQQKVSLPRELYIQLKKDTAFMDLSKDEQLKELSWCIEKCKIAFFDYKQLAKYYARQLKQLNKLQSRITTTQKVGK